MLGFELPTSWFMRERWVVVACATLTGLLAGVLSGLVLVPVMGNVGFAGLRPTLLARLGLPAESTMALAYFVDRRFPTVRELVTPSEPGDVGAVAVGPGGLAFLGLRGTRYSVSMTEITGAEIRRVYATFPFRSALGIRTRDGAERWIAFLGGSYAANRRAARAALETLSSAGSR